MVQALPLPVVVTDDDLDDLEVSVADRRSRDRLLSALRAERLKSKQLGRKLRDAEGRIRRLESALARRECP